MLLLLVVVVHHHRLHRLYAVVVIRSLRHRVSGLLRALVLVLMHRRHHVMPLVVVPTHCLTIGGFRMTGVLRRK